MADDSCILIGMRNGSPSAVQACSSRYHVQSANESHLFLDVGLLASRTDPTDKQPDHSNLVPLRSRSWLVFRWRNFDRGNLPASARASSVSQVMPMLRLLQHIFPKSPARFQQTKSDIWLRDMCKEDAVPISRGISNLGATAGICSVGLFTCRDQQATQTPHDHLALLHILSDGPLNHTVRLFSTGDGGV